MTGVMATLGGLLAVAMLGSVIRVMLGPTVYDRVVGAGTMGTSTLILVGLLGWADGRLDMFVDIALAYAMLNFVGAVTVAKYLNVTRGSLP